jgi:hypothetical protein
MPIHPFTSAERAVSLRRRFQHRQCLLLAGTPRPIFRSRRTADRRDHPLGSRESSDDLARQDCSQRAQIPARPTTCEQAQALDADRRRDALNHNGDGFQIVINIARWFTHCQYCATPRRQRRYNYAALTLLTVPFIAAGRAAIIDGTNATRSASRLDGATSRSTATENLGRCC